MRKLWVLGLMILGVMACTKNADQAGDAKTRLRDYITKSFSVSNVTDRKELESYLTGDVKSRFAAWSDAQFEKAFMQTKRSFLKIAYKEVKEVSENETQITYEITYTDQGRGQNATVTNKKLSYMVRENGVWYIRDVKSIKELVEYQNEMTLP